MAKNRGLCVARVRRLMLPFMVGLLAFVSFVAFYALFDNLHVTAAPGGETHAMDVANAGERCFATPDGGATVFSGTTAVAVQEAVDAAGPGGTVKIAGHCTGVQARSGVIQTVFISKSLTLAGAYTVTDWLNANPTQFTSILDATGAGRVVYMDANVPLTLTALTITNGRADRTGSFACPGFGCGAGIFARGSLVLHAVQILSNTGNQGAGVHTSFGPIHVTSSYFYNNHALTSYGGGIFAGARLVLSNTHLVSNTASAGGGAFARGSVTVIGGRFQHNQAREGGGGGMFAQAQLAVTDTHFISNTANTLGGGAFIDEVAFIENSRFENNVSENGDGGALVTDQALVERTLFLGNRAFDEGGGAWIGQFSSGVSRVDNSLFARNRALGAGGDALYLVFNGGGMAQVRHSTIVSPTQAGGTAILAGGGVVTVTNSIIVQHSTGISHTGSAAVVEDFNLFFGNDMDSSGVSAGANSRSGDPAFVGTAADDYHLTTNSAAINAGVDIDLDEDFEGDMRPSTGGFDIGFDESPFTPTFLLSTGAVGDGSVLVDPIQASYAPGTVVTVTAVVSPNTTFLGWSGDLSSETTSDTIVMDANKTTFANFSGAPQAVFTLTVRLSGDGGGQVTSIPAGIDCGAICTATFTAGTVVTLTAKFAPESSFGGWTDDCSGVGECVVLMDSERSVTADIRADFPNPDLTTRLHLPVMRGVE